MTRIKNTYLAALAVLLSPIAANADAIVSTLPQTSTNTTGVGGSNDYAAGFVWDSGDDFGFAELYLDVEGNPSADLTVSIFDSLSGSPGSLLLQLAGPADITGPGLYTYSGILSLIQGSTYWLVASTGLYGDFSNEYIWFDGTFGDTNYVDTQWRASPNSNWGSSGIVRPAAFAVHAATAVPEPGTLALLGLGLAGIGFARRKKV